MQDDEATLFTALIKRRRGAAARHDSGRVPVPMILRSVEFAPDRLAVRHGLDDVAVTERRHGIDSGLRDLLFRKPQTSEKPRGRNRRDA